MSSAPPAAVALLREAADATEFAELRDLLARCQEPLTGVPPSAEVLGAMVADFRLRAARIRELAEADEAVAVAVPAEARNDPAAYRPVFTRLRRRLRAMLSLMETVVGTPLARPVADALLDPALREQVAIGEDLVATARRYVAAA